MQFDQGRLLQVRAHQFEVPEEQGDEFRVADITRGNEHKAFRPALDAPGDQEVIVLCDQDEAFFLNNVNDVIIGRAWASWKFGCVDDHMSGPLQGYTECDGQVVIDQPLHEATR
jgi:hypothetical protein